MASHTPQSNTPRPDPLLARVFGHHRLPRRPGWPRWLFPRKAMVYDYFHRPHSQPQRLHVSYPTQPSLTWLYQHLQDIESEGRRVRRCLATFKSTSRTGYAAGFRRIDAYLKTLAVYSTQSILCPQYETQDSDQWFAYWSNVLQQPHCDEQLAKLSEAGYLGDALWAETWLRHMRQMDAWMDSEASCHRRQIQASLQYIRAILDQPGSAWLACRDDLSKRYEDWKNRFDKQIGAQLIAQCDSLKTSPRHDDHDCRAQDVRLGQWLDTLDASTSHCFEVPLMQRAYEQITRLCQRSDTLEDFHSMMTYVAWRFSCWPKKWSYHDRRLCFWQVWCTMSSYFSTITARLLGYLRALRRGKSGHAIVRQSLFMYDVTALMMRWIPEQQLHPFRQALVHLETLSEAHLKRAPLLKWLHHLAVSPKVETCIPAVIGLSCSAAGLKPKGPGVVLKAPHTTPHELRHAQQAWHQLQSHLTEMTHSKEALSDCSEAVNHMVVASDNWSFEDRALAFSLLETITHTVQRYRKYEAAEGHSMPACIRALVEHFSDSLHITPR